MFQESYMRKIVALIGVMAVIALIAYTYSTVKQAKYLYQGPTTISVMGEGEVFAKPDVAAFSFSVESKEADATSAQDKAAETMDEILEYLKEEGIEEKDIKTEYYNFSPRYEYPEACTAWNCPPRDDEPKLIGYQVTQSVSVKVRDMEQAGKLVAGVGDKGAMNVSGVSFTIDDEESLKAEAREKAIADAKEKAEILAANLGTRIVRMTGFWEEEGGYPPMPYGYGGADMAKSEMDATQSSRPAALPSGENTVTSRVNISYEIR